MPKILKKGTKRRRLVNLLLRPEGVTATDVKDFMKRGQFSQFVNTGLEDECGFITERIGKTGFQNKEVIWKIIGKYRSDGTIRLL